MSRERLGSAFKWPWKMAQFDRSRGGRATSHSVWLDQSMAKGVQGRLESLERWWREDSSSEEKRSRRWQLSIAAAIVIGVGLLVGWLVSFDCARSLLLVIGIGAAAGTEGSQLAQRTFAWADRASTKTPEEREADRERRADEFPPAGFVIGIVLALLIYGAATKLFD